MSTLAQSHLEPAWKEEVNRRLAEHKSRKAGKSTEQVQAQAHQFGNSRAAQAAARVAARYSKAQSYTQMQAEEARTAVRAAEIATQVALEAQAAAESALAELHAAASESPSRGPAVVESITRAAREEVAAPLTESVTTRAPEVAGPREAPAAAVEPVAVEVVEEEPKLDRAVSALREPVPEPVMTHEVVDGKVFDIRWEPDMPVRGLEHRPSRAAEELEFSAEDWWTPAQVSATLRNEPIAVDTEIAVANLIEFPRELVAARKMRPRLAEAPAAAEPERQLSIFEVDPGAVSTEPAPVVAVSKLEAAWAGPEWSGIQLDAHPLDLERAAAEPAREQRIFLAPMGRRLMATVVDGSLILGGVFSTAMMLTSCMSHAPAGKAAEMMLVCGVAAAGFLYHALFYGLGWSTAGMRYAGIALCNFEDECPSRAQLRTRLAAMALSLLPMGLGMVWSLFDEDRLSWHDRISQTYLRKR